MNAPILAAVLLAAPLRLVGEVESRQEMGLFPNLTPTADGTLGDSWTLARWTLRPELELRAESRRQDLAVAYQPQLLLQSSLDGAAPDNITDPLVLHVGQVGHTWRAARGVDLVSSVSVRSGEIDLPGFAAGPADDGPVGGLPTEGEDVEVAVGLTQADASTSLQVATGDTESLALTLRGGYLEPFGAAGDAILASYELGLGIEYARYLIKDVDAVFDASMTHLEFFELDRSSRQAQLRVGATWSPRRTLRWDLRAGVLAIVGDQSLVSDADAEPEPVREVFPSGRLSLDWVFVSNASVQGSLQWSAFLEASRAAAAATFVPQVGTGAGVLFAWPGATLTARAVAATALGDLGQSEGVFLPTFYSARGTLDVPASRNFAFFFQVRGGQRAPALSASELEFGFTELVGLVGVRVWFSTGRDVGLDRPARVLDAEDEEEAEPIEPESR